eukprot:TRINITY_DN4451_c0_g1_i5.p1 TRINITY_DN4451_c0_g1~~TRINITY_DN4451_c0_g1_i5.p1  ORF type:complete len:1061 (-),score=344.87 TRINITY_DN4451_c0_g1_i5:420-3602(-)
MMRITRRHAKLRSGSREAENDVVVTTIKFRLLRVTLTALQVDTSPHAPSAAVFQDRLFLVWQASNASKRVYISSSDDGTNFSQGVVINASDATARRPTIVASLGRLYVFMVAPDNAMRVTRSADGRTFLPSLLVNDYDRTADIVAPCALDDTIGLFWRGSDSSNLFSLSTVPFLSVDHGPVNFPLEGARCYCCDAAVPELRGLHCIQTSGAHNFAFLDAHVFHRNQPPVDYVGSLHVNPGSQALVAMLNAPSAETNAVPDGVTMTVTGPGGVAFNRAVTSEDLIVRMAGDTVVALMVRNPAAGDWTIRVRAPFDSRFFARIQTLPTENVQQTMGAAIDEAYRLGAPPAAARRVRMLKSAGAATESLGGFLSTLAAVGVASAAVLGTIAYFATAPVSLPATLFAITVTSVITTATLALSLPDTERLSKFEIVRVATGTAESVIDKVFDTFPEAVTKRIPFIQAIRSVLSGVHRISDQEAAMFNSLSVVDCITAMRVYQESTNIVRFYADQQKGNAIRHCVWQARLTQRLGFTIAKQFGDAHEAGSPDPVDDHMADVINNVQGRALGQANANADLNQLRLLCETKWANGELRAYVPTNQWKQTAIDAQDYKIRKKNGTDRSQRIDFTQSTVMMQSSSSHGQCGTSVANGFKFVGQGVRLGYAGLFVENTFATPQPRTEHFDTSVAYPLENSAPAVGEDGMGVAVGQQWSVNSSYVSFPNRALTDFGMEKIAGYNQLALKVYTVPIGGGTRPITTVTPPWGRHIPYWTAGGLAGIDVLDVNTYPYFFRNAVCTGIGLYKQDSGYADKHPNAQMDRMAIKAEISAFGNTRNVGNPRSYAPVGEAKVRKLGSLSGPNSTVSLGALRPNAVICGVQLVSINNTWAVQLSYSTDLVVQANASVATPPLAEPFGLLRPVQLPGKGSPLLNVSGVYTRTSNQVITGLQLKVKDGMLYPEVQLQALAPDVDTTLSPFWMTCGQVLMFPPPYHKNKTLEVAPLGTNSGWYFSTHSFQWTNAVLTGLQFHVDDDNVISLLPTISVVGYGLQSVDLRIEDGRIEADPEANNFP